ncbi:hypothetical protein ANN_02273 [Periplaneta americana]|uniref:ISXO2-like transposase domain-containing protein n=1 Tax=Periplaneta americana TaxID=6978 RepID=A0ABQ8TYT8_PERAM|nr:hypothetical protein ANN_02273 [Periplaneta americana]
MEASISEDSSTSRAEEMTWLELIRELKDRESTFKFCQQHNLLPSHTKKDCVHCGAKGRVSINKCSRNKNIPYSLRCSVCERRTSITINTWFENANITMEQSLQLIYCWLLGMSLEYTAAETKTAIRTTLDYFSSCREVCYATITNNSEPIGGTGHVVEIDESRIATRKYKHVRLLPNEEKQIWVFKGIDRETKDCFITRVNKRDKSTLLPIILHFILPGTRIIHDGWKSYSALEEEGYIHDIANHKIEFIRPDDAEIHTERLWKSLKTAVGRERQPGQRDEMYIFQIIYMRQQKAIGRTTPSKMFLPFLKHISEFYPGYGKDGLSSVTYTQNKKEPVNDPDDMDDSNDTEIE